MGEGVELQGGQLDFQFGTHSRNRVWKTSLITLIVMNSFTLNARIHVDYFI